MPQFRRPGFICYLSDQLINNHKAVRDSSAAKKEAFASYLTCRVLLKLVISKWSGKDR